MSDNYEYDDEATVYYDDDGDPFAVIDGETVWVVENDDGTITPIADFGDDDDFIDPPEVDPVAQLKEQHQADLLFELQQYQEKLGRRLTTQEVEVAWTGAAAQFARGQEPDVDRAFTDAGKLPKTVVDMDREEHRQFQVDRLSDNKRLAAEPNNKREYSNDDDAERREWMARRLAGDDVVLIGGRSHHETEAATEEASSEGGE